MSTAQKVSQQKAPTQERSRRKLWIGVSLLVPALIIFAGFFLVPQALLLRYSLNLYQPGKGMIPAVTLSNYTNVLLDPFYLGAFGKTLVMGLAVTACCLLIGYPVGLYLARLSPAQRSFYLVLLILPLLSNQVVRSYGWLVLIAKNGLINTLLIQAGVISEPLPLIYNLTGILIGMTHITLPFMILTLMNSLQKISPDVEAAARVLGAGPLSTFLRVTLPLSLPGVYTGSILVFTLSIGAFVIPAILGGVTYKVIATVIYQQMMQLLNWPLGAAISFVLLAIVVAVIWAGGRLMRVREP